jgi:flagellar protein FliS
LAAGDIAARSKSISKAYQIVVELSGSLDRERGAEISRRLTELYDYMERRLIEANLQQSDAPLGEVRGLLATLAEAWDGIRPPAMPAAPAAVAAPADNPWTQPPSQEPATVYADNPWAQPAPQEPAAVYADNPWAQPLPQEPAGAYASQAWSF